MATEKQEKDPLDYLPDNEAEVVAGVIAILDAVLTNAELKANIVGSILAEIEDWGDAQPKAH